MAVDRSKNSHAFENMVEHLFLGELLRHMWFDRQEIVEVAKAQVDSWGYDVVLAVGHATRYVQLKTSLPANVQEKLAHRPGGCIVAVLPDRLGHNLTYRFWEGDAAAIRKLQPAKSTVYKRGGTKREERPGHRLVPNSQFSEKMDVRQLCSRLFP